MLSFNRIYKPVTARPFLADESYMEYKPCEQLCPYISCYWTEGIEGKANTVCTENISEESGDMVISGKRSDVLVIPDTCMDIIVRINHTRHTVGGYLCTLQDEPGIASGYEGKEIITCFAVRFYFWAASLFINMDFRGTCNGVVDLGELGLEWQKLFDMFLYVTDMKGRIAHTEEFLMRKLEDREKDPRLFNAFHKILTTSGRESVREACEFACVSQRQMERIVLREIGVSLKRISNLVRYQNVWREMIFSQDFDIHDAVYRYGYTDQPHLLREFKRFHGVPPEEARSIAYRSYKGIE